MENQKEGLTKQLVDAILNNIYMGLSVIDKDGVVRFRNRVAEDDTGIKNEDILGKGFADIDGKDGQFLDTLRRGIPSFGVTFRTCRGDNTVVNRIPLISENRVVGAMTIGFHEDAIIPKKYAYMEQKLQYYEKELRNLQHAKYNLHSIIGRSEKVANIKKVILKYTRASAPVLITGPTGTGKELCAHAIHLNGSRRDSPFVRVNCASIPHDLFESELFGYEPGAFTGASSKGKIGKFELANHGTIFLDEISSLPVEMQPKLLRVLQERELERIGGNKARELDVRVVSATNVSLESLVHENKFREDLYYRIKILTLDLPSLTERKEDIPLLCEHFIKSFNEGGNLNITGISPEVINLFSEWHWPGNVRELRNVLETAVYLNETGTISPKDLPSYLLREGNNIGRNRQRGASGGHLKEAKKDFERSMIETELARSDWNKARAARQLGISRPQLYTLLKQYGIKKGL